MKLLAAQLEAATGGIVVHRSGGTVFLYRGDDWGTAKARVAAAKAAAAAKQQQQPEAAAAGQEPPEQQPAAPHP